MGGRFVERAKSIRVAPELFARAERLLERIAVDPQAHLVMGRASVSAVLRLAIMEGLTILESRYEKA